MADAKYKFGFIGVGNMGFPILKGAAALVGGDRICFTTASGKKDERIIAETGAVRVKDNAAVAAESEIVVFAVKPQMMGGVFEEVKDVDLSGKVVLSVAAGVSCEDFRNALGSAASIVRVMPNTPAMVGEGMSCVCFDGEAAPVSAQNKQDVFDLLSAVGKYQEIPERLMNAAICANGSSPAYVYMFIEALADSVVKYGIPRDMAYKLVAQTVLGSAKMVLETGEHPGKLKDNVCSPGGTTIAGVSALEEFGMRNSVIKATDACFAKSEALGKKK